MDYKAIPGFEDKFEIGEDGTVRNIKTKRETTPYRVSKTLGPLVHIFDRKTNRDARLAVLKVTNDLFGKMPEGWDEIDVNALDHDNDVKTVTPLTAEEKAAKLLEREKAKEAEKAEKDARKKARAEKKAEKEAAEGTEKGAKALERNRKRIEALNEKIAELEAKRDELTAEVEKAVKTA